MENYSASLEKASSILLGLAYLIVGFGFALLGITWLPVLGLLIAIPFVALAYYMWTPNAFARRVQILIGAGSYYPADYAAVAGRGVIPVAILSTSRARGDSFDFDVKSVDPKTIRLGPKGVRPVGNMVDPGVVAGRFEDIDGDGDSDLVFYFPLENAGITPGAGEICIMGETVDGETIRGCSRLELAAA